MSPPIAAAFYAALNALILLWLAVLVVRRRGRARVGLGDGGDAELGRLIRGHANAAEWMPMGLLLLALTEVLGAPGLAVHATGASFTLGRLLHGLHFAGLGGSRAAGMILTVAPVALLALGLLARSALEMVA